MLEIAEKVGISCIKNRILSKMLVMRALNVMMGGDLQILLAVKSGAIINNGFFILVQI